MNQQKSCPWNTDVLCSKASLLLALKAGCDKQPEFRKSLVWFRGKDDQLYPVIQACGSCAYGVHIPAPVKAMVVDVG